MKFSLMMDEDWFSKGMILVTGMTTKTTNVKVLRHENRLDRIMTKLKAKWFIIKHLT